MNASFQVIRTQHLLFMLQLTACRRDDTKNGKNLANYDILKYNVHNNVYEAK